MRSVTNAAVDIAGDPAVANARLVEQRRAVHVQTPLSGGNVRFQPVGGQNNLMAVTSDVIVYEAKLNQAGSAYVYTVSRLGDIGGTDNNPAVVWGYDVQKSGDVEGNTAGVVIWGRNNNLSAADKVGVGNPVDAMKGMIDTRVAGFTLTGLTAPTLVTGTASAPLIVSPGAITEIQTALTTGTNWASLTSPTLTNGETGFENVSVAAITVSFSGGNDLTLKVPAVDAEYAAGNHPVTVTVKFTINYYDGDLAPQQETYLKDIVVPNAFEVELQ